MKINPKKAIFWTIAFCFLYSTTDEIHQTFVLERTGQLLDCMIDTLGAIIGSIFIFQITRNNKGISKENLI
jgi:VanZ family protein